jgi:Protein of unknown function (DUF732)
MSKLKTIATAALATAGVATAVAMAAPAQAGTPYQNAYYLQLRNAHGMSIWDTQQALRHADWICQELNYRTGSSIAAQIYYGNGPYSWYDATSDVADAATAICPWQL